MVLSMVISAVNDSTDLPRFAVSYCLDQTLALCWLLHHSDSKTVKKQMLVAGNLGGTWSFACCLAQHSSLAWPEQG